MGIIKEPKDIDMSTRSEPWTEKELAEFREIMQQIKGRNAKQKKRALQLKGAENQSI